MSHVKLSGTPIDENDMNPLIPDGGPAVVPGAGDITQPPGEPSEGAGADMGPAGGPDGAKD